MDQDAFRQTYRDVNERACLFEKSVLINQCQCTQAKRFCIAEREGVQCLSEEGHGRCEEILHVLREQARFALRNHDEKGLLPHGKAMRVQVGGMRGIRALLEPDTPEKLPIPDIDGLLRQVVVVFGALQQLPFSKIMPSIAAYKGKTRAKRRKRD